MKVQFTYDNEKDFELEKSKIEKIGFNYSTEEFSIIIDDDHIIENCLEFVENLLRLELSKSDLIDKEINPLIKKLLVLHNKVVINEEIEE